MHLCQLFEWYAVRLCGNFRFGSYDYLKFADRFLAYTHRGKYILGSSGCMFEFMVPLPALLFKKVS